MTFSINEASLAPGQTLDVDSATMDFELTDEQRLIQNTVREFVDDRVLPNAIENDINHHLDLGIIEGMAELGLLGIVVPEEYGGAGPRLRRPRRSPARRSSAARRRSGR